MSEEEKIYFHKVEGLKEWWNRNAKPKFKIRLSQEEFARSVKNTFDSCGYVLMASWQNKKEKNIQFFGKIFFWDSAEKDTAIYTD